MSRLFFARGIHVPRGYHQVRNHQRAVGGRLPLPARRLLPALLLAVAPLLNPTEGAVVHADGTCTTSGIQVQCVFGYTGAPQTWTAPLDVTSATFDVFGAQGGGPVFAVFGGPGGAGGEATATLSVTPGAAYQINVGGAGTTPTDVTTVSAGGFNGGGPGGGASDAGLQGAGGGGASDVRISGGGLANRLLVAGGGGGTGGLGGGGGGGGGYFGGGGGGADGYCTSGGGGSGTQTGGGSGGRTCVSYYVSVTSGSSGSSGVGGAGGGVQGLSGFQPGAEGSGGAGESSTGGSSGFGGGGGGGGGSGFGPTGVVFTSGVQSGNGRVVITFTPTLTTAISLSPSSPNGQNGWYTSPVTASLSATDPAYTTGIQTRCVLDPSSPPTSFSALPSGCAYLGSGAGVGTDGVHTLYAASQDPAGTVESSVRSRTFKIDATPPTVTCTATAPTFVYGQSGTAVTASVSDATSGPSQNTVSAAAPTSSVGSNLTASLTGLDNAGNSTTISCPYNVTKAATSTQVASSLNPAMLGQAVTLTATLSVQSPGAGAVTGTVTFMDGTATLGTGAFSTISGVSTASLSTNSLALGPHTITAAYGGSANFTASTSATLTQNVDTNLNSFPKLASGAYNLSNLNLAGGYFANLNLAGADVSNANVSGANFSGANLSGTNLTDANFSNTNLIGANLSGANLTQTNLKGATGMSTATLAGVIWSKTTCPDNTTSTMDGGTCIGHL